MANAMDGSGASDYGRAFGPSSESHDLYPVHSARAAGSNAGNVATLLHALACRHPGLPRSFVVGIDAPSGSTLPSGDNHRQDAVFGLRGARVACTSQAA